MATWNDLARRILGGNKSDEYYETILWTVTAFPCVGVLHVARQLREFKKRSRGGWSSCMACGGAYRHKGGILLDGTCGKCWWDDRLSMAQNVERRIAKEVPDEPI